MRPARQQLTVLEHGDLAGQRDRAQPVGDDERGAPGHRLAQRLLDRLLGARVDRRGRVVEDEDARVGQQRARDGQALTLAARQRQAALADARVVALGQLGDEPVGLRPARGSLDLLARGVLARVGDVLGDRGAEQERVVVDDRDRAPQRAQVDVAHVGAVDEHAPGGRVVQPGDELHERRLARPRRADQRERRPGLDVERDVVQRVDGRALVAQRDVAQLDAPRPRRQRRRPRRGDEPRGAIEDLEQPRPRRRRPLRHAQRDTERAHRGQQHQQVGVERGEVAQRHLAVDHAPAAEEEDRRQAQLRQEADERVVEGLQPGDEHRLLEDAPDGPREALALALLARERLDHADAGDVLLGLGGQLGDALLDLLRRRPRAAPVARGDEDHERHR